MISTFFDWTLAWVDTPYGIWALFLIAFVESFFLLPPPDIPLMVMVIARPSHAAWFAAVTTAGSVLGGICGYGIGLWGGKAVLKKLLSPEKVKKCHEYFEKYEAWAIGIAGFTPLPYKVFTISAGAFEINFPKFVLASLISRGLRFFMVAFLLQIFGLELKIFIEKYFNIITIVIVLLAVVGFYLYKLNGKKAAVNDEPVEE